MELAIIGYGKMGQRIESLSNDFGFTPKLILDEHNNEKGEGITTSNFADIDVAIDFSHPEAFKDNLPKLLSTQTPLVIGTTGWLDYVQQLDQRCKKHEVAVLYGSNFSLGVQLFGKLIRKAGELFGGESNTLFDTALHEIHHIEKEDAPSGTANTLAELWHKGADLPSEHKYGIPSEGAVDDSTFYITSQRLGSVFGEHTLRINSRFDDITISHTARSRDAFAAGALKSARWIVDQDAGFYQIEDVVEKIT